MKHLLNLIRWKNLLLLIIAQVLIKYGLFNSFHAETLLTTLQFSMLIMATICLAAAGNVINDIYDVETDTINKPNKVIVGKHVSEKFAFNLFIAGASYSTANGKLGAAKGLNGTFTVR